MSVTTENQITDLQFLEPDSRQERPLFKDILTKAAGVVLESSKFLAPLLSLIPLTTIDLRTASQLGTDLTAVIPGTAKLDLTSILDQVRGALGYGSVYDLEETAENKLSRIYEDLNIGETTTYRSEKISPYIEVKIADRLVYGEPAIILETMLRGEKITRYGYQFDTEFIEGDEYSTQVRELLAAGYGRHYGEEAAIDRAAVRPAKDRVVTLVTDKPLGKNYPEGEEPKSLITITIAKGINSHLQRSFVHQMLVNGNCLEDIALQETTEGRNYLHRANDILAYIKNNEGPDYTISKTYEVERLSTCKMNGKLGVDESFPANFLTALLAAEETYRRNYGQMPELTTAAMTREVLKVISQEGVDMEEAKGLVANPFMKGNAAALRKFWHYMLNVPLRNPNSNPIGQEIGDIINGHPEIYSDPVNINQMLEQGKLKRLCDLIRANVTAVTAFYQTHTRFKDGFIKRIDEHAQESKAVAAAD